MNVDNLMPRTRQIHPKDCTCGTKSCTSSQWAANAKGVFAYVHHNHSVAALVTVHCDTDFALRTELVRETGRKLAMHAVAAGSVNETDTWSFDSTKTVKDVLDAAASELGERFQIAEVHIQR